jgi:hypothetical protein
MPCLSVEQKPKNKPKKQNLRLTKKMQILFLSVWWLCHCLCLHLVGAITSKSLVLLLFLTLFLSVLTSWKKREWKSGLCFSSSDFEKKEPKQLLTFFIFAVLENELFQLLLI